MFKLYDLIKKRETKMALLDLEEELFKAAAKRSYEKLLAINSDDRLIEDPWF